MINFRGILTGASALGAVAILGWAGYETFNPSVVQDAMGSAAERVHGEGKKPLSCDMSRLLVNHQGRQQSYKVRELISLDAEGLVHESSRRIKRSKVMPMVELLNDYPDAIAVEFRTCEAESGLRVPVSVLQADPYNYLLSFNNTGRARVIVYQMRGKRAKYVTEVKNLHQLIIYSAS